MTGMAKKKGGLYGVSLGVGHPMNITVFALRVLNGVNHIFVPKSSEDKESQALQRIKKMPVRIDDKKIIELHMPMEKAGLDKYWKEAASQIVGVLKKGDDAAFAGIGDLLHYGTFFYIERMVRKAGFEIMYVPGITSFQALAASFGTPLVQGEEGMLVLPSDDVEYSDIRNRETIVFMKKPRNKALFKKLVKTHRLFLGLNLGLSGEKTGEIDDIEKDLQKLPYFSLIIARRRHDS